MTTPRRSGRPPKRPTTNQKVTITIRIPGNIKNLLMDQADAYDLSLGEYITTLIQRDANGRT